MKKLFVILLITYNLFAWEVNTHRAIDREALNNASNLNAFVSNVELFKNYKDEIFEDYGMTYFKYIGEGELNGLSDLKQIFDNTNYKSLLEAGTILEDAQWPHSDWWPNKADQVHGRFLNHFYNPQDDGSGFVLGKNAVNWAYNSGNQYDYTDAMKYFAQGFSEPDINNKMKEA